MTEQTAGGRRPSPAKRTELRAAASLSAAMPPRPPPKSSTSQLIARSARFIVSVSVRISHRRRSSFVSRRRPFESDSTRDDSCLRVSGVGEPPIPLARRAAHEAARYPTLNAASPRHECPDAWTFNRDRVSPTSAIPPDAIVGGSWPSRSAAPLP